MATGKNDVTVMDDVFPTGRVELCWHCGDPIAEVQDRTSGVLDWYSSGGDFGCPDSPDTVTEGDDAGTGSHEPQP